MKMKLQAELFQRYPLLFRQAGQRLISDPGEEPYLVNDEGPIDYYGVECGDGWMPIIERVAARCEGEIHAMMIRGVPREEWPRCVQIKEKLGMLRFCFQGEFTQPTQAAIEAAEQQSAQVCEICGMPAELRQDEAYLTLCTSCAANQKTTYTDIDWSANNQYLSDIQKLLNTRLN